MMQETRDQLLSHVNVREETDASKHKDKFVEILRDQEAKLQEFIDQKRAEIAAIQGILV